MKIEVFQNNTITTPVHHLKARNGKTIPSFMFPVTPISPGKGDPKGDTLFLSFMEYNFSNKVKDLKEINSSDLESLSRKEVLDVLNEPNNNYLVFSALSKLNEERFEKYLVDDLLKINIEDLERTEKLKEEIRNHINNKSADIVIDLEVTKIIRDVEADEENDFEAMRIVKDRYNIDYIYQYLALQYYQILLHNIPITICENPECSRVFFPLNKGLNEKYCDNVFKNGKTCKEIVPMMNYKKDALKSQSIKLQDKYRRRKCLQKEYNAWKVLNNGFLYDYTQGLMHPRDYKKWLDKSNEIMNDNDKKNKEIDFYEPYRVDYFIELKEKLSCIFEGGKG